jgi:hypothetical protein
MVLVFSLIVGIALKWNQIDMGNKHKRRTNFRGFELVSNVVHASIFAILHGSVG